MVERYYEFVKNFYAKGDLQVEDYRAVFNAFGIPEDIEDEVITKCNEFQMNNFLIDEIRSLYSKMVREARSLIQTFC